MTATRTAADRLLSDAHKDAYGFRPSAGQWAAWAGMTDAELDIEEDRLYAAVERSIEQERQAHLAAEHAFEQLVAATIEQGAGDRATAIRWLMDAECSNPDDQFYRDPSYLEYQLGLSYGYIEHGRRA